MKIKVSTADISKLFLQLYKQWGRYLLGNRLTVYSNIFQCDVVLSSILQRHITVNLFALTVDSYRPINSHRPKNICTQVNDSYAVISQQSIQFRKRFRNIIAIGNLLKSSPGFPPLHTVRAPFDAHGVPSIASKSHIKLGI